MIRDDYKKCEEIIKKNSTTFYKSFKNLSESKRNAVYAIYAFCRIADDIVDVEKDANKLNDFYQELELFKNNKEIDTYLWRSLRDVFNNYKMDIKPFLEMIEGQRYDLNFKEFKTIEELDKYCYLVAGTVGLMLLPIISNSSDKTKISAINLGKAMQYTNILRDIDNDLNRGRIYLPLELFNKYNYTKEDLSKKIINKDFILLWEDLAEKAETLYKDVLDNINIYDEDARFAIILSINYYQAILNEIRKNNYNVFKGKIYVNKVKKLKLFMQSKYFLYKGGLL